MLINGVTKLIAHIGYPTTSFKAPMIYNPYFESIGLNAVVMPMGVPQADFAAALPVITRFTNFHGALITMPHKVTTLALADEVTPTARIAGACNGLLKRADGTLLADMFDGDGFTRGVQRKGRAIKGASVLVVGSGGVGSAIAASFAREGVARLGLYDVNAASMQGLADRIRSHYPALVISPGSNDPAGYDIVVNATPLGMNPGDPMPMDMARIASSTFVGEVVMKDETTSFLAAALARGCQVQVGLDMLYEMIPAYLEFFGFPTTTPDVLRKVARIVY